VEGVGEGEGLGPQVDGGSLEYVFCVSVYVDGWMEVYRLSLDIQ
jgi:hypothetical protein